VREALVPALVSGRLGVARDGRVLINLGLLAGAFVAAGVALVVGGGAEGVAIGGSEEGGAESAWVEAARPGATVRFFLAGGRMILVYDVSSVSSSSVRSDEARSGTDLADEGAVAGPTAAGAVAGTEVSRRGGVVLLRERGAVETAVVGVATAVVGG